MKKLFLFIVNRHQDILRYLTILASAVVISLVFPRTGIFKYEFEIGKPWKYESLIAPFDIAIQKTQMQLDEEKEWLLEGFSPYYRLDPLVAETQEAAFIDSFNARLLLGDWKSKGIDSLQDLKLGLSVLQSIYSKGLIYLIDEHKSFPPGKEINILTDENVAEKKLLADLLTIKEAFDFARDTIKSTRRESLGFLLPLIEESLDYNVLYDGATTTKYQNELVNNISLTRGKIQEGELIISKGAIVTPDKYQMLESFRNEFESKVFGIKKAQIIYLGNLGLTIIVLSVLALFIRTFSRDVWENNRKHLLVFLLITLMLVTIGSIVKTDLPILYAIPVCILPLVLRNFFGAELALHAHIAMVVLSAFLVPDSIQFAFLQIIAGMVAIVVQPRGFYWSQVFALNGIILLAYVTSYLALSLVQEGSLAQIHYADFGWLGLNALLTLLAYPLIPIFEKSFGFVSQMTLIELSDIHRPLLKELSIKAPGTFQHSLQVANLAEAAAAEIGANTALAKTGALYHDIGKMKNPLFFIENQNHGINPHDDLTFEESARVIIGHVKEGIQLAHKHHLPDILIDFIRTHHGTTVVQYFYQSYLKNFPEKASDIEKFRYPGPLPYSKETAIVMMADSVEAAARSLKNPTSEDIESLVDHIISSKIKEEQLINSNITFKEITLIKKVMKKMLNSIYHARIAYPEH